MFMRLIAVICNVDSMISSGGLQTPLNNTMADVVARPCFKSKNTNFKTNEAPLKPAVRSISEK